MCCLIYKFLLILTQKMQISFLKILPENALKFVSKKMRICVKNFAQLHIVCAFTGKRRTDKATGIVPCKTKFHLPGGKNMQDSYPQIHM